MTQTDISSISPFFIVSDAPSALSFDRDRLGFEITFQEPADEPFFGIVRRGVNNLGFTVDWGGEELGLAGILKGNCRMFLASSD